MQLQLLKDYAEFIILVLIIFILLQIITLLMIWEMREFGTIIQKWKKKKQKRQMMKEERHEVSQKPKNSQLMHDLKGEEENNPNIAEESPKEYGGYNCPQIEEEEKRWKAEKTEKREPVTVMLGYEYQDDVKKYGDNKIIIKEKGGLKALLRADGLYEVVPADDVLAESSYEYSPIKEFFEVNVQIVSGNKYQITNETIPAIVRKEGIYFILEKKGSLSLRKIN